MESSTPLYYFSTWLFIIALIVLVLAIAYGYRNGFSSAAQWTIWISGLITAFALWWMILNYVNDTSWMHNRYFHEKQVFPEQA